MTRAIGVIACAALLCACGAKSGLRIEDDGAADAGAPDPPPRDAGRERGDAVVGGGGITGTWVGPVTLGENERRFTVQLHRRADGEVMGFVLGGTSFRVVDAGSERDGEVRLELDFDDPRLRTDVTIVGRHDGRFFTGTADSALGPRRIEWVRVEEPVVETRYRFTTATSPSSAVEVAIVVDARGFFLTGGFVSEENCDPFACGGGALAFEEDRSSAGVGIAIDFESGGDSDFGGRLVARARGPGPPWFYEGMDPHAPGRGVGYKRGARNGNHGEPLGPRGRGPRDARRHRGRPRTRSALGGAARCDLRIVPALGAGRGGVRRLAERADADP